MTDEDRRMQYKIRWEMVRYEGQLYWSRIQTASAIEGAFLAALYAGLKLTHTQSVVLAAFGSAFVFIVCLWAIKDGRDSTAHREQANRLEGEGLPRFEEAADVWGLKGTQWTYIAIGLLTVFNVLVLLDQLLR